MLTRNRRAQLEAEARNMDQNDPEVVNNGGNGNNHGGGNQQGRINQEQNVLPRVTNMREFLEVTRDYGPRLCDIEADNNQIPPQLINLVQQGSIFQGHGLEDPISHLTALLGVCNTYRNAAIPQDKLIISLFPFSLRGAALDWFYAIDGP